MTRFRLAIVTIAAVLVAAGAFASAAGAVEPGGHVGAIFLTDDPRLVSDTDFFQYCRPDISKPGVYRRSCSLPFSKRLFIGYGDFETSPAKLDAVWSTIRWTAYLDGRKIDLPSFGTETQTLDAYPPAGGRTAYVRQWRITANGIPPGKHRLRWVAAQKGFGTEDVTWTFTMRSK
ncbi:MAG TPA: hypothetical protein VMJ49_01915 [Gaiellaceae bacterium]|nr:hypothetical protein [Gaiellaceae bacterium]